MTRPIIVFCILMFAAHGARGCDLAIRVPPQVPERRVEIVTVDVSHGFIGALRQAPIGWRFTVDNDPSWTTSVTGVAIVGAADLEVDRLSSLFSIIPEQGLSCGDLIENGNVNVVLTLSQFDEMKGHGYRVARSALDLRD